MCQSCWKRDERSWRVCRRCGELRPTQGRDPADRSKVICQRCYRHARPTGTCEACGRIGRLARTGARGGPQLCGACADRAHRPVRECGRCGQVKPIAVRRGADGTEELCFGCYAKTPRRICGGCGQHAAIHQRGHDGSPDLCLRCYRPPIAHCSVCGRDKPCSYANTATPVCWSCKPRRVDFCAVCGRERPVKAASAIGPLCGGCEWQRLRAKATCERCGQDRRPALHNGSEVLCGDCAGIVQTRTCTDCGIEDITYDRGRCPACSLHARLERWRTDAPAVVIARLEPHLAALESSPTPLSVLQWLAKPGGRTLANIAAGSLELSHYALDALARGKSTADLRAALVHADVLDRRDEVSATMSQWTADRLAALDPGPDATSVRAFANWKVARELAVRRARKPGPDPLDTTMPKHWVTAAVELTKWLDAQHLGLDDLDQSLLDAWLAGGPATRGRTVRPFVAWLERNDRRGLRIPTSRASTRVVVLDDEHRLAALRTLLHDDAVDSRLRLAGCLVALYAQPVARIVRLTAADLRLTDAGPQIRLGRDMAALPAQLGGVAELLLAITATTAGCFPARRRDTPLTRRISPGAYVASGFRSPVPVRAR